MRFRRQSHDALITRHQPLELASRLKYLRVAISGAYICGILISPKLWFGVGRTFPRVPFVNGLPAFVSSADFLLSSLLLVGLTLSIISSRTGRYLVAVLVLTSLLVLIDQTRLQPWVYQYVVMLAVIACWRPGAADTITAEPILLASQLVMALLYFWSGLQKLNWSFGHEVMPALLESVRIHLPASYLSYLPAIGIVVGLCEALIGVGLLIRKTRQTAVVLALCMHLLVLLMLVASLRNSVVWAWNIGMMVMVVLLFWRRDDSYALRALWRWKGSALVGHLPQAVLVICGLAPVLSFAGWWDQYLSAALYSGKSPVGVIRISESLRERLPETVQKQVFTTKGGELMLPFYEWSMAELNVPPYPEVQVYRRLAKQVCKYAEDQQGIELIVKDRISLIDGSYEVTRTDCSGL